MHKFSGLVIFVCMDRQALGVPLDGTRTVKQVVAAVNANQGFKIEGRQDAAFEGAKAKIVGLCRSAHGATQQPTHTTTTAVATDTTATATPIPTVASASQPPQLSLPSAAAPVTGSAVASGMPAAAGESASVTAALLSAGDLSGAGVGVVPSIGGMETLLVDFERLRLSMEAEKAEKQQLHAKLEAERAEKQQLEAELEAEKEAQKRQLEAELEAEKADRQRVEAELEAERQRWQAEIAQLKLQLLTREEKEEAEES